MNKACSSMLGSIAVWLVDARAVGNEELVSFHSLLSASEAARFQRFMRRQRQRQFLIGRVLLRIALGKLLNMATDTINFAERSGQAPQLILPDPALGMPGFSLSHSGDWVACAVSADTALGLDIEVIDPTRDFNALAGQAFDAGQAACLPRWEPDMAPYPASMRIHAACAELPHSLRRARHASRTRNRRRHDRETAQRGCAWASRKRSISREASGPFGSV